jgi:hypothetical protein
MSLVPHKITALAESDAQGTDGKNIVAGAVVSLYDNVGAAVTLFDDAAGSNGSTTKQTDAEGQVVVYVNPGEYSEEVNGGTRRRVVVSDNGLRSQLAAVDSDVLVGGVEARHLAERVVSPEQFGAVGNGVTLDTTAWLDMLLQLKTAGGGTVKCKAGATYLLADETTPANSTIFDIDDVKGLTFDFNGATIKTTNASSQGTINLFKSVDGKNIEFKNAIVDTPRLSGLDGNPRGIQFFLGFDKCRNIIARNITGFGGVSSFFAFERSDTSTYLSFEEQARNIILENIDFESVGYLGNFRFNGSGVFGRNLKVGYAHRVWFPYGVEDHDVEFQVNDFSATGARIWAVEEQLIRNIRLKIKIRDYPTSRPAAVASQIAMAGSGNPKLENITLEYDVEGGGNLGRCFQWVLESAPTTMFEMDGLTLTGTVRGVPFPIGATENGGASFADHVKVNNIRVKDLNIEDQTSGALLFLTNSDTDAFIERVSIKGVNSSISVADTSNTYEGVVRFDGCEAGRMVGPDTGRTDYNQCRINDANGQKFNISTYENTFINGLGVINKKALKYVVPESAGGNSVQENAIAHRLVNEGGLSSTLTFTLLKGTYIYPEYLPAAVHSSSIYSFSIGLNSSTDKGGFAGTVLLQSDGTGITSAQLGSVEVVQLSGTGLAPEQLSVTISGGSPVFQLSAGSSIYQIGEIVIREI